jgi:hypothetical protein
MTNPAGERPNEVLRVDFDRRLTMQFRGSVVTSDAGPMRGASCTKGSFSIYRDARSANHRRAFQGHS